MWLQDHCDRLCDECLYEECTTLYPRDIGDSIIADIKDRGFVVLKDNEEYGTNE